MYTPARLYSGLPCPANAGHPVTRGAKKGTEPSRGAGVTGSPAYAGDDSPEVALPAYANVNVYHAGRLDEQETRWQRRQIEAPMLRESKISMSRPLAPPFAGSGEDRPLLQLDKPAIVFGGPYGNLEATRALLEAAEHLGVPGERMICTGVVVAYCADPAATVDLVRRSSAHVVMGNCEESLAAQSGDCGCGFVPGSACEKLSAAWFAHADRMLDGDARAWMASLPRRIDVDFEGLRLAIVHGGVTGINRFLFASTVPAIKAAELDTSGADGIIGGHCGLPFTQIINGKLWHN